MARLTPSPTTVDELGGPGEANAGTMLPLRVEAQLQQGIVLDPRYGVSFDGLLAAQARHEEAAKIAPGTSGSDLDGGLVVGEPVDWPLPLSRCPIGGDDWHWLATTGQPVDHAGAPVRPEPDAHRLFMRLDERRAEQVAISVPKAAGGARGRFRNRLTPVLAVPCAGIVWHVVGDPEEILRMVAGLSTVGARRGTGEGAIVRWTVDVPADSPDPERFAHLHPDGSLGRPVPQQCADWLGIPGGDTGYAGLRPPMFHPSRQRLLVLPR